METSELQTLRTDRSALEAVLRDAGTSLRGKVCKCPFHDDKHPSAGIYEKDGIWRFRCQVCDITEDIIGLKAKIAGAKPGDILKAADEPAEPSKPLRVFPSVDALLESIAAYARVEGHYTYTYKGRTDMIVVRCAGSKGGKSFLQARPQDSGFVMRGPIKPLPIYNRTRVEQADDVVVCEGEKCVHAFHALGFTATTSPGGAGKAKDADWSFLSGKQNVYLWPDNDAVNDAGKRTGFEHMKDVQAILEALPNPPLRIWWIDVDILGLPPKGDIEQFAEIHKEGTANAVAGAMADALPTGPAESVRKLITETIAGNRTAVSWCSRHLTELTQSLTPGSVTIVCGDGGSTKTWFILQNAQHWQDTGIPFALRELEEDEDGYTLNRVMAQREGDGNVMRIPWISANPELAKKCLERHAPYLEKFAKSLWAKPGDMPSLDELTEWVRDRAKEGRRVIVIDPITAADSDEKPWIADKKFIRGVQGIMRDYRASLILVTHPKQGRKAAVPTMDEVSGGAAYQRFTQNVFWLSRHEDDDQIEVQALTPCNTWQKQWTWVNRVIRVFKARNGTGTGFDLGFKFGTDLQFLDCGAVVKKNNRKTGAA